ncbi:iron chelate uptake ABC transporter family permease subunit [Staphylospora marina]|uniref:metal ABC transporter permease n=1 Tax=Staphylospora marina TaxID=2490858 RepID=UPI000F5BFF3C|nr:iron chelate uptake ABC transporter family permease subunit [Staphylospora marina]
MSLSHWWILPGDPNAWWVLSGTTLLGLTGGVLGSFAFLRKRGLMGDVLAHAALPGICLAFMLTGSKHPLWFLLGAAVTGLAASLVITGITRFSRIKEDAALGLVLSVFFGIGIVLLTHIQHSDHGNQSGLDSFLFGQAASMVESDVRLMGGVAVLLLVLSLLFFKELKLLCFDASFGRSLGFPMGRIDFLLMMFLVVAVVIGLQAAGIVLMAALLITPAAAARFWTERLNRMIIISAIIGAASGMIGTAISAAGYNLSTGPLIVLSATAMFAVSMVFAPRRGLLAKWIRLLETRRRVARERILSGLYDLLEQKRAETVGAAELEAVFPSFRRDLSVMKRLEKEGVLQLCRSGARISEIGLTPKGWDEARDTVLRLRMLDVWLMHEHELDQVLPDREREEAEIPESIRPKLMELIKRHNLDPSWHPRLHEGGSAS